MKVSYIKRYENKDIRKRKLKKLIVICVGTIASILLYVFFDNSLFNKGTDIGYEASSDNVALQKNKVQEVKEPKVIVEVDLDTLKKEQKSVDEGHSPWKLDPVFVAQVFTSLLLAPEGITGEYPIKYDNIKIVENNSTNAVAEIMDNKSIAKYVYMKRLIRQDDTGIWTVVGYDPAE